MCFIHKVVQCFFYNTILTYTIFTLGLGTLFIYVLYFFSYYNKVQNITIHGGFFSFMKYFLLLILGISFIFYLFFIYFFYCYFIFVDGFSIFSNYSLLAKTNVSLFFFFEFSVDIFGVFLLFLAYFVGILSLLALDNRFFWKNIKYLFTVNVFIIIVFFYVFSTNVLMFFLFYELLMLPSFLFVYYISPSRRAIQASLYFLIWTQVGSFLVLLVVAYLLVITGSLEFTGIRLYNFTQQEAWFIYFFLFLGFGVKVPLWPFHYWLTKTHVEAPAGFSMYLSGFLVKSAVYGFYKITQCIGVHVNTTLCLTICIVGVVDASLKMWGQTDLKKLVAYGTIQEMNLIFLTFCWGDTNAIIGGILFSITHGALSALMFYLVDCVQRRFNSRSVIEVSGILQITPILGISNIIMCILYAGLPGTLKFACEFYIFSGLLEISPVLMVVLFFIANVLGVLGFAKCWFDATFGMYQNQNNITPLDLNTKEFYIIYIPILFLFLFPFFSNYFY